MKLSPAQHRMLREIAAGRDPWDRLRGRSQHGGAVATQASLLRHGLVRLDARTPIATSEGKALLAALAAAARRARADARKEAMMLQHLRGRLETATAMRCEKPARSAGDCDRARAVRRARYTQEDMNILETIVDGGARLRETTKAAYKRAVRDWLAFAGEDPAGWTPLRATQFYSYLLSSMKPQSAGNLVAGLKYASVRYARVHGGVDFASVIETIPAEERDAPEPLRAADLHRLLATTDGTEPSDYRDRALILLGVTTGMRRAGLVGIRFQDFVFSRFGYHTVAITLKGGKRFAVPILPQVDRAMEPWRRWLKTNGVIAEGPFFRSVSILRVDGTRTIGRGFTTDGLYKALLRRANAAKLALPGRSSFHPHVLRHTFITRCRDAGVPVHEIAAITGHGVEGGGSIDRFYVNAATIGVSALQSITPVFADLFEGMS